MAETLGKQLSRARLARGLTIDAAAHATKMRPDKIVALENDDYSRFGSNAYAKGFLTIYGRFLRVDVSQQAERMDTYHHVRVDDYQYLNNAPEPAQIDFRPAKRERRENRPPSIVPLLVFMAFLGIVVFGFWVFVSAQRLGLDKRGNRTAKAATEQTTARPAEAESQRGPGAAAPQRVANEATGSTAPNGSGATAPDAGTPGANPGPVTSLQPGAPTDAAQSANANQAEATPAGAAPGPVNEVVVEPLKKTWVTIRKDRPDGPAVFEDFLYPGTRPLKLRGSRFFVEVRDETAVQIRKNGNPIAYQAPGVDIH